MDGVFEGFLTMGDLYSARVFVAAYKFGVRFGRGLERKKGT